MKPGAGKVAQVVECLPIKYEVVSLNSNAAKTKPFIVISFPGEYSSFSSFKTDFMPLLWIFTFAFDL
jgi:hypothetical protein